MTGTGKLGQLVIQEPWPYVNHYSFHILDPDWGHLTIKMSGHPPFGTQVMLNGHEYVVCQAQKSGSEGFHNVDRWGLDGQVWWATPAGCWRRVRVG